MKTMTLDDLIKNPLTEEDRKIINSAKPVVTEECPEVTDAQMKKYRINNILPKSFSDKK